MTDAEKRDQSIRVIDLPDCCGNCRHWLRTYHRCLNIEAAISDCEYNQLCDLHERRIK